MANKVYLCQCPEWGELHFYLIAQFWDEAMDIACQCPKWGELHFYEVKAMRNLVKEIGVNALKGATFISTRCGTPARYITRSVSMP